MVPEDTIEIGKREATFRNIIEDFHKNPDKSLYKILQAYGMDEDWVREEGFDVSREFITGQTRDQQNHMLGSLHSRAKSTLEEKVMEDFFSATQALGNDDNTRTYVSQILENIKPLEGNGLDADICSAHSKFYKAIQDLQNPVEKFAKLIEDKKDTLAGQVIMYLAEMNPNFVGGVMDTRAKRSESRFYNATETAVKAKKYLINMYNASEEDNKKAIAYYTGIKYTDLSLEREAQAELANEDRQIAA